MFVEYRYTHINIGARPDEVLSVYNLVNRYKGLGRITPEYYAPAAIRIKKRIHKFISLTMCERYFTKEYKIDLKFKDNSIQTAEIQVTINLSSRS